MASSRSNHFAHVAPLRRLAIEAPKLEAPKPRVAPRAEWSVAATIACTFLPWLGVVLFTAGTRAALSLLAYSLIVLASGYGLIRLALPASDRSQTIALAPATGILVLSSVTAFWIRLGLPLLSSLFIWIALTLCGAAALWRDRAQWTKASVSYGRTLGLLSALVCALFFLPSALNDT